MVPRKFVMLYVASPLCQSHRAGAKAQKTGATQPDDVSKRPISDVTDGASVVCMSRMIRTTDAINRGDSIG
jgi:hypothetical protein